MKIALIAAPFVEIPPKKYGGHERILDYLAREISKENELTLYCSGDSSIQVDKRDICGTSLFADPSYDHTRDRSSRLSEINKHTVDIIDSRTDIVNCHDYDNPDLIRRLVSRFDVTPILVSIGHAINPLIRGIYEEFRERSNVFFHGLSASQLRSLDSSLGHILNGIDLSIYPPPETSDLRQEYFFSLGDTKPIKGHGTAIRLARESGLSLVIAGVPTYPESRVYFEREISPAIDVDVSNAQDDFLKEIESERFDFGKGKIIYFGSASDDQKRVLFGHAFFTQFFGNLEVKGNIEASPLVPLESLLCGTPVVGVKGSVTEELVDDGVTGFNVARLEEIPGLFSQIASLDRKKIRAVGERDFSSSRMARDYIDLYKKILGGNW